MIERLDELRGLLEGRTSPCPDGYHALSVRDDTLPCPTCCGAGRIPDPRWAPMLALCHNSRRVASCDDACGLAQLDAEEWWSSLPEGALTGAIREAAWHAGIPRPVLDAAFAEIFGADSPNQAAVDWAIAWLTDRRD